MDYPYVINYFLMLWLAYLYWKKPNASYIKWAFILQFIFIAFRAPVVGADTWNYVRYLTGERSFYNYDSRALEPGFILYREALASLHLNRFLCMIINSFLSCYPVYLLIKKYSFNAPLSLALLSIYNLYLTYFCGLRQILGLAILFMCILYVIEYKKQRWFIYCLGTILGYTFHTSIILYSFIFVSAYFLKMLNKTTIITCIAGSAIIGIVLQSFNVMEAFNFFLNLNFSATERLQGYMENDEINEISSIFLTLRPTIIALLVFLLIDKTKLHHWFSNIYFLGIVIGNLFISVPMINRITIGMNIFAPIVFTWIFGNEYIQNLQRKKITNVIMILFFLYFSQMYIKNNLFSAIDLTREDRMHPYLFIWENYSNHPSIKYFN